MLFTAKDRPPHLAATKSKSKGEWTGLGWNEFYHYCEKIGLALKFLGVKKGDRVAVLSNTRVEWQLADLSTLAIGGVTVPIYQSNTPDEILYVLNDSKPKVLFCEDKILYGKFKAIAEKCPFIEKVILMTENGELNNDKLMLWTELLTLGQREVEQNSNAFAQLCGSNDLDQMATIIYTSGTTGNPKGVVLAHRQIVSEIVELFDLLSVDSRDCTLTFLPFAHVVGRIEMWGSIYKGYTVAYAESIDRIKRNLEEVKPTLLIAVPRIFEKIYNGILSQVQTNKLKQNMFAWAIRVGAEISRHKLNRESTSLVKLLEYKLAKVLVFDTINQKLGGRLRFAFSGGAPLSKSIGEFFHAAGLLILEGYGLTETTAAVTVNTPLHYRFGTVGTAIGDVDIKIADDGEVLIKSDKVMKEYYNNPEATKEVFLGGYFATGDIGEINDEGFLRITDRKKDLIKTAGGKYVAPQKLEGLLKLNPYISNVLIHGDQRKYVVALVTLDEASVQKYAQTNQLSFSSFEDLAKSDPIRNLIHEAVKEANGQLASYETIKNFEILPHDFTIESGELTPSLKVKRKVCDKKYSEQIDRLYGTDNSTL